MTQPLELAAQEAPLDRELTPLVERVLELLELPIDPQRVRDATHEAPAEARGWAPHLTAVLGALGVRASPGSVPLADARIGASQPAVIRRRDDGALLVVTEQAGAQWRVEDPATREARWLGTTELSAVIERGEPWLAIDAAAPLAPLARGSAHDAPRPRARLLALMRLDRSDLATVLVYAAAIGVLGLTVPIAVQALVSTVAFGTVLQPLVVLSIALLVALSVSAVLRALQAWVVEVLQRRLFVRVVADLAHRLPRVRREALDGRDGAELVNRFFDVFTVQKAASALLLGGVEIALAVIVGLVVLAFYHPLLLALDLAIVLAVAAALWGLGRRGVSTAIAESKAKYAMAGWLQALARRDSLLQMGGAHRFALERCDVLARHYLAAREQHWAVVLRQLAAMLALQAIASALVLGIGGWLVIERQLTLGQLVAAELLVTAVVASLAKFGKYLESYYDLLAALDKLGQLLDLPTERDGGARIERRGPMRVDLDRVRAGYGSDDVLRGISLRVEPRERVAITGPSGAGKSLLLELIAGAREPTSGCVRIDGHDLRDVALGPLRELVAAVTRPAVVPGSILDNVRLGRDSVGGERARAALAAVGLDRELERLPDGLSTVLTRDGAPLSGQQALRLALARAIAAEPALLIIDHALDGLDAAAREPLLDVLFAPDAPWTLIVASGDPEVIARAGRALVLVEGRWLDAPEGGR